MKKCLFSNLQQASFTFRISPHCSGQVSASTTPPEHNQPARHRQKGNFSVEWTDGREKVLPTLDGRLKVVWKIFILLQYFLSKWILLPREITTMKNPSREWFSSQNFDIHLLLFFHNYLRQNWNMKSIVPQKILSMQKCWQAIFNKNSWIYFKYQLLVCNINVNTENLKLCHLK